MFPLSTDVLLEELNTIKIFVDKWQKLVSEHGVPGVDSPGTGMNEANPEIWVLQLVGELKLTAGKCENLAQVLAQVLSGTVYE